MQQSVGGLDTSVTYVEHIQETATTPLLQKS